MIVERIAVGGFQENTFIIGCEETKEGAVIDPGMDADRIIRQIDALGLNVTKIINTHAHIDHIGAVEEIRQAKGAKFYIHKNEEPLVKAYDNQCQMFGVRFGSEPGIDGYLEEGDVVEVGNLRGKVILTPGHSPGGICFHFGERVFVGDALFMGSIGRTDLPGGNTEELISNIKNKLLTLPPETIVHCGHGPDTTIGREKESNPFLTGRGMFGF